MGVVHEMVVGFRKGHKVTKYNQKPRHNNNKGVSILISMLIYNVTFLSRTVYLTYHYLNISGGSEIATYK